MADVIVDNTYSPTFVQGDAPLVLDPGAATADLIAKVNALQPSENTLLLRAAVRNYGFYPQPSTRLAAGDVPTVTFHGFTNFELAGSWPLTPNIAANSSKLTYISGPMVSGSYGYGGAFPYYPRGGYVNGARSSDWFVQEFECVSAAFEVPIGNNGAGGTNFRIYVNDCLAHESAVDGTTGLVTRCKVVFPGAAARRIRIETTLLLKGINVANVADLVAPVRSYPLLSVLCDSFGGAGIYGQTKVMAKALGMRLNNASVGATGLIASVLAEGKQNWQHAERLKDLTLSSVTDGPTGLSMKPNLGVLFGTQNDIRDNTFWGGAASNQAAVYNATMIVIDDWLTNNPSIPLVVFGPWGEKSAIAIEAYRVRDAMQQAAARAGKQVYFVDKFGPDPILRQGVRTNAADQASLYTGTDNTHPTNPAGHDLDGLWMANEVRKLMFSEFI